MRIVLAALLALAGLGLLLGLGPDGSPGASQALRAARAEQPPPVLLPPGFALGLGPSARSQRLEGIEVLPLAVAGSGWDLLLTGQGESWVVFAPDWAGAPVQDRFRLAWAEPPTPLLRARVVRVLEALLVFYHLRPDQVRLQGASGSSDQDLAPAGQDLRSWIRGSGAGQGAGTR